MTTLGEWVLDELLGEGAFGRVWRAHARSDPGKLAAVKVPRDDRGAALLEAEGAAQSRLASSRFPRVLGVSTDPPYIAFEYVHGESLRSLLLGGKLPEAQAHDVVRGVLLALSEAHAKGIAHRDLKPENVLVARDGRVLVTDFGLALPVEVEQSLADMEGSVAGSIPYMAPEVREGKGALARSDLYAWGVLLFEVLTGALPGAAETPSSLGADKKWDDVYRRACARLEARFESADEALAALPAAPAPRKAAPPKVDVRALLDRVAKEEAEFLQKEFMAYVTPEGKAHARVRGKTYSFDVKGPPGLAILRATGPTVAVVVKRFGRGV